ncbi:hypothetical protein OAL14_01530, partial [Gammaproteobacteria bacterium]|nr:hypothetical protein [Gammaproteobacteria bacterium]
MKQYWRFYWPLALTGIGLVLSVQFQNAILARYPEAVKELAVLAIAYGIYGFFNASLAFVAQLTNVYARSHEANRRVNIFVAIASLTIASPLFFISATNIGSELISLAFQIESELVHQVR